ncbi:glycosyltransferase [Hymenobacter koreensis]|uniref:Glycosyltransferase family 4 protein n=1 Tax=Hymenobacter koreensis TaxID=1084523 RepID=A0ABP8J876_9BACT
MTASVSRPVRVLLASVLKPVDDTRMVEKFGRTLAEAGYEVHVAGRQAPDAAPASFVQRHVLFSAHRLAFSRLTAQWRYWQLLMHRRTAPDVVVVHAPELLPLTLLWHFLNPKRAFLYDVRENYALNIETQQVYPKWLRGMLARAVRAVETAAARLATQVLLAERSYADELPFATPERTRILENKYQPQPGELALSGTISLPSQPDVPLRLLYSGTISELNGVFDALRFAQALHALWPGTRLTIMGYCQRPEQLRRLQQAVADAGPWVQLIGGAALIPHPTIVAEIQRSHFGLIPYQPHPSTWLCVPTKLFEYLANGLPMLVHRNPHWSDLVHEHQAGLLIDFATPEAAARLVADALRQGRSFYASGAPASALWASEAPQLLAAVATALRGKTVR